MKYVISLFLTITVHANPIHLFHENNLVEAEMMKEILIKDYFIPEELITLKMSSVCENQKAQGRLDICLKNNGDLLVVSVDRRFINESLKIFQAP